MSDVAFERIAERWLAGFQIDLKDFVRVVCEDADLSEELRSLAIGAVFYALAPGDVVPDSSGPGPLGYVDDALALRVVLGEIATQAPDRLESYTDRLPEIVAPLDEDLEASRAFFGEMFEPFRTRVMASTRIEIKGKKVADILVEPAWLDDEVAVAALKLDFKPSDLASAVRRVGTLPNLFRQRLTPRR